MPTRGRDQSLRTTGKRIKASGSVHEMNVSLKGDASACTVNSSLVRLSLPPLTVSRTRAQFRVGMLSGSASLASGL